MKLSVVIPAFNVSDKISTALDSIFFADLESYPGWELEVIVVDDGSKDSDLLIDLLKEYPDVSYTRHDKNRGMCGARNTGIKISNGDYVTLLDADDEYVPGWFVDFVKIVNEWPQDIRVCLSPCINDNGELTCKIKGYRGYITPEDMVMERYSGEYNPIFLGQYIRDIMYVDIGTRKSCGLLSYLRMIRHGPFWITDRVQRIYHTGVSGSVTKGWTRPEKTRETYICYKMVLEEHGDFIKRISEGHYRYMRYKLYIYGMLSGNKGVLWDCIKDFSWGSFRYWLVTCFLIIAGPRFSSWILQTAKRYRLLRQYG